MWLCECDPHRPLPQTLATLTRSPDYFFSAPILIVMPKFSPELEEANDSYTQTGEREREKAFSGRRTWRKGQAGLSKRLFTSNRRRYEKRRRAWKIRCKPRTRGLIEASAFNFALRVWFPIRCGRQIWVIYDPLFKPWGRSNNKSKTWKGLQFLSLKCDAGLKTRPTVKKLFEFWKVSRFSGRSHAAPDAEAASCTWDCCWHRVGQFSVRHIHGSARSALARLHASNTHNNKNRCSRPVHWHCAAWVNDSRLIANWERFNEHRELPPLQRASSLLACIGDRTRKLVSRVRFGYETIFSCAREREKSLERCWFLLAFKSCRMKSKSATGSGSLPVWSKSEGEISTFTFVCKQARAAESLKKTLLEFSTSSYSNTHRAFYWVLQLIYRDNNSTTGPI